VVSSRKRRVFGDRKATHRTFRDSCASLVVLTNEMRTKAQARSGARGADVVEDSLVTVQRATRPVLADLAEEAMFNRVPLGGAGGIVGDGKGESVALTELALQPVPPGPARRGVAATGVG